MSLDSPEESPALEDIMDLIEHTLDDCAAELEDNADPDDPDMPKLRWVGSQMIRVPFEVIWSSKVKSAYHIALDIGYVGSFEEWEAIIQEELERDQEEEESDESI
jgi:hypothetical protein